MLSGGMDISITVNGRPKAGMYERGEGQIARRVELPEWLSKKALNGDFDLGDRLRMPAEEIGESRGHIFINPPRDLFPGPAVGIDLEVWSLFVKDERIKEISFYVYAHGYRLVDVWAIDRSSFNRHCKEVRTKACFMPQVMVPLTALHSTVHA